MKRLTAILLAAACLALGMAAASAQDKYPSRTVKILVPYAPGGATDITARIVGDQLQKITGQPFVIINKPGAFGLLGDRRNGEGGARRLHADDRQRLDQRHHADPLQQEDDLRLRQERRGGDQSDRRAGLHAGDDGERFSGQERGRTDRLRQEEPRQGALRHRRHRLLSALRHGLFRQARRRSRHGRAAQQERRLRRDPGHAARRRAGRVPQRRQFRRHGEVGQVPSDRGGEQHAARRTIRTFRP